MCGAALTLPPPPVYYHPITFAHQQSHHQTQSPAWRRHIDLIRPFQRQTLLVQPLSRLLHPTRTLHPPRPAKICFSLFLIRFALMFMIRQVNQSLRTLASYLGLSSLQKAR